MKAVALFLGAAAFAAAPALAQIAYGESVPVQLEGGIEYDPCSLGMVTTGGDPDSSVMVRTGPDSEYETVDYLSEGDMVWVCQTENGHHGIVYSADPEADCEVSGALDNTINYSGPCESGWVVTDWVEIVAG